MVTSVRQTKNWLRIWYLAPIFDFWNMRLVDFLFFPKQRLRLRGSYLSSREVTLPGGRGLHGRVKSPSGYPRVPREEIATEVAPWRRNCYLRRICAFSGNSSWKSEAPSRRRLGTARRNRYLSCPVKKKSLLTNNFCGFRKFFMKYWSSPDMSRYAPSRRNRYLSGPVKKKSLHSGCSRTSGPSLREQHTLCWPKVSLRE